MEKKNIAGYISGLLTAGAGLFGGSQAALIILEALGSGALLAAPIAIPVLAGALAVTGIGFRTMVNTFKGNRNVDTLNKIESQAKKQGQSREEFINRIVQPGLVAGKQPGLEAGKQSGLRKGQQDLDRVH